VWTVEWVPSKKWMMFLFGLLCQHIVDLSPIKDIKIEILTMYMFFKSVLNFLCIMCICIGFGERYTVAYAAICTDGWLSGTVIVFFEYFYNGIKHLNFLSVFLFFIILCSVTKKLFYILFHDRTSAVGIWHIR